MLLPSYAHIECILNGHRLTHWAGEDPPFDIQFDEQVENPHGHDGIHYPMSSGNLGGTITFKFVPHSTDTQWVLDREKDRQAAIINRESCQEYNGILQDVVTGIKLALERGYLISCDRFPLGGHPFQATFSFERMIPEYESTYPFTGRHEEVKRNAQGNDFDRQDFPGTGL